MIKTQRHRPDTCDCVILEDWNTEDPQAEKILNQFEYTCPAHAGIASSDLKYQTVRGEYIMKNQIVGGAIENISGIADITLDPHGQQTKKLKPGKDIKWMFDENRNLEVEAVGFSKGEEDLLSAYVSQRSEYDGRVTLKSSGQK